MGTANFAKPSNASKYYTVLTNREVKIKECPHCDHQHLEWECGDLTDLIQCELCNGDLSEVDLSIEYLSPEDWEVRDLIENLGTAIGTLGGTAQNEFFHDLNYPRQTLGILETSKNWGDVELIVKLTAILQSAYYEGATLDWLVQIEANGELFDYSTGSYYDSQLSEILAWAFDPDYSDLNDGLCKIMQPKAKIWIESQIKKLSDQLEYLYKLNCIGTFSNGEAVYETT